MLETGKRKAAEEARVGTYKRQDSIAASLCDTVSTASPEEDQAASRTPEEGGSPQRDHSESEEKEEALVAAQLKQAYSIVLERSLTLPEDQRLVMYDPHDANEIAKKVGPYTVRLDARRAGKPKAAPAPRVVVCPPLDPTKFNFTKIKNADERMLRTTLAGVQYDFLTNKFPLCTCHSLLVSRELMPQQMAPQHLRAIHELLSGSSFFAYFNSWGAAASVNHFHMHVIDEKTPLFECSLERAPHDAAGAPCYLMPGHPASHSVLAWRDVDAAWRLIEGMQQANVPHNLAFSASHVYIFPRDDSSAEESLDIYGEKPGGLELCGIFTVYSQEAYDNLSEAQLCKVLSMNTCAYP